MKKLILIAAAVSAAMSFAAAFAAVPEPAAPPPAVNRVGVIEKYVLKEGSIKSIRESDGIYSLLVSGQTIPFALTLDSETLVLDASDLEYKTPCALAPGMDISVACEGRPGMSRYINSVSAPAAVIIKHGANVNLSVFDSDYTAYDLSLKLLMADGFPVYNAESRAYAESSEDIPLKEALVIYSYANGGFPPETEPDCVLILRDLAQ